MYPLDEYKLLLTRRQFFSRTSSGIGVAALASLLCPEVFSATADKSSTGGLLGLPHFAPRAKRVLYLFQCGAPSQLELFDYKPKLKELHGTELPDSVRQGQRITSMTLKQKSFPVCSSTFKFNQHGKSGAWISELLPHTAKIADDITIITTIHTEAINHDPAMTFMQSGSEQPGRPSMGTWVSYGLGSENQNLPAFVVLLSKGSTQNNMSPIPSRLWGSGFLPSDHQGVQFRSPGDPVLYLLNPPGIDGSVRRTILDGVEKLNRKRLEAFGDPEIETRIAQFEMAYRMQTSVPELTDLSGEPEHIFEMYGPDSRKPGTYARNCLLARRLLEKNVRFVQLYHRDWDQHEWLPRDIALQCRDTDQASAALIMDLKQRGMLDDTLVIWGGEFGRTVYCQGQLRSDTYGRDHHPRCFSIWIAGGGIKSGITYGKTDDYCYNILENPVHVHDLQATVLHCLGVDHTRLTFKFQGRNYRLTDIHGRVVEDLLS